MKTLRPLLCALAIAAAAAAIAAAGARAGNSTFVDTRRGTSHRDPAGGAHGGPDYSRGNTIPATALPFGAVLFTPTTNPDHGSGFLYDHDAGGLQGFRVSHESSTWGNDYGWIALMPQLGPPVAEPAGRRQPFRHADEIARPDYYSVLLGNGIRTEIAPTMHGGVWRFRFPSGAASLLFDVGSAASIAVDVAAGTVKGHADRNNRSFCPAAPCNRLYFSAALTAPITGSGRPDGVGVSVQLATAAGEAVVVRLATSFISQAQADDNLAREIGTRSFDEIQGAAQTAWDAALGSITFGAARPAPTADQRITFYSCLYRAFLYPTQRWETVGDRAAYWSPYSNELVVGGPVASGPNRGKMWVNNGLWDTYRAARPLLLILKPALSADILQGFVNAYLDGGWTPRWTGPSYRGAMLGSQADILFADAYVKGVTGFDYLTAYESMLKNATSYSPYADRGRKGNERALYLGYVPHDVVAESLAWQLENDIADAAIAEMAGALGRIEDRDHFRNRALAYVHQFSATAADRPTTGCSAADTEGLPCGTGTTARGFFRGRNLDGSWRTEDASFYPQQWGHEYTEGNAWHYALAATHDPQGMANLYGGRAGMAARIDAIFAADRNYKHGSYGGVIHEMAEAHDADLGQFAINNENVHSLIYLYSYAGTPWKTQQRLRDTLTNPVLFGPGTGDGTGYLGDEDGGQVSAWYVFGILGFYPASPARPEYVIGSPPYGSVTIHLESGRTFTVRTIGNGPANRYIQRAVWQPTGGLARRYSRSYLTHADIVGGGTLTLTMGPRPSRWGSGHDDLPPSMTSDLVRAPVPREGKDAGGEVVTTSAGGDPGRAFDNDALTTWAAATRTPRVAYGFASAASAASGGRQRYETIVEYTVTSGEGDAAMDPRSWTLDACCPIAVGGATGSGCACDVATDGAWVTLDRRSDESFAWKVDREPVNGRRRARHFAVRNATPYASYRLRVTANGGHPSRTEIAEIDLVGDAPVAAVAATSSSVGPGCTRNGAIDGLRDTAWCPSPAATAAPASMTVDLGARVPIQQIVVRHAPGVRDYRIDLSSEPVPRGFRTQIAVTGDTATLAQHTLSTAVSARYVRLVCTSCGPAGGGADRVHEIEIYAPKAVPWGR